MEAWIPSQAQKEGTEDAELLRYRGVWQLESAEQNAIPGDLGLALKTPAAHHAISAKFSAPLDNTDKTLVVQYDIKLQKGLECGGAYMKLLTFDSEFEPSKFDDKTPYTIMFGPDRCGGTNKVHFIFRHQNPITGKIEENHLKNAPQALIDSSTHLYTLIVRPDQTFEIKVDHTSVKTGSLLSDFDPPVVPSKGFFHFNFHVKFTLKIEISDPNDLKPVDWVDEEYISDPEAKKPEDWYVFLVKLN